MSGFFVCIIIFAETPQRFGCADLDAVDVVAVPQRLEDAVREAQHENVLHRFLAQIVVDAVNVPLGENIAQQSVQLAGRFEVAPERLFDHDAPPASGFRRGVEARFPQTRRDDAV